MNVDKKTTFMNHTIHLTGPHDSGKYVADIIPPGQEQPQKTVKEDSRAFAVEAAKNVIDRMVSPNKDVL